MNKPVKCEDNRSKKIVFLSSCLINQNNRFPGIAVCQGPVSELINSLANEGVGIEQLPCLECLGWGGVNRNTALRFLPTLYKHNRSKLMRIFANAWWWNYSRLCKKEAKKIANRMKDYVNSNYQILAIVATNDSPTCGITKTIKLLQIIFEHEKYGVFLEDLQSPTLDRWRVLMPNLLIDGQGTFMRELARGLKKKKINAKILGFNPWADLKEESERIKKEIFGN